MDGSLQLPARFNGEFGIVLFHQHHGVLLLRSGDRDDGGPRRIDLLFRGVVWLSLPCWFSDFTIERCLVDEVIDCIPPSHRGKAQSRRCIGSTSTARRTTSWPEACSCHGTTSRISIARRCYPRSRSACGSSNCGEAPCEWALSLLDAASARVRVGWSSSRNTCQFEPLSVS